MVWARSAAVQIQTVRRALDGAVVCALTAAVTARLKSSTSRDTGLRVVSRTLIRRHAVVPRPTRTSDCCLSAVMTIGCVRSAVNDRMAPSAVVRPTSDIAVDWYVS